MFSLTSLTDPAQNYFSIRPGGPRGMVKTTTGSGEPPRSLQMARWQPQLIQGAISTGHEDFLRPMPLLPSDTSQLQGVEHVMLAIYFLLSFPSRLPDSRDHWVAALSPDQWVPLPSQPASICTLHGSQNMTNQPDSLNSAVNAASPPQNGRLLLPLGTPRKKAGCWNWVSLQTARNSCYLQQTLSGWTLHIKEDPQWVSCLLFPLTHPGMYYQKLSPSLIKI